jgi:hypothetical protein
VRDGCVAAAVLPGEPPVSAALLVRFTCGHVGRTNDSWRAKTQAFIRVAEIRGGLLVAGEKPCPDCKRPGS